MTTLTPLTSAELADLKAKANTDLPPSYNAGLAGPTYGPYFAAHTVKRLIATIEQQREQIEKLRQFALDVSRDPLNAKHELALETLAIMEPVNDKR